MQPTKVPLPTALLDYLVELFMVVAPHDALSSKAKAALLRWRGARVGARVKLWRDIWVDDYRQLALGDDVSVGKSVLFICGGGVRIGNRVMIAHGARIVSSGHRIPDDPAEPLRFTGPDAAPILIEDDVWVGTGAIVLAGVTVGRGAIVAAGAVVTHDVAPGTIVGGVPARMLRQR
jgi:acetyltransferase-like isoleucine patch superfamily enzyme